MFITLMLSQLVPSRWRSLPEVITNSLDITLPATASGKPYIFVVTDGNHEQIETDDCQTTATLASGNTTERIDRNGSPIKIKMLD
jgi:hypothetical protein